MDYRTYTTRLQYLLELLEKGQLKSPSDLIDKFECSEKTVRRMINFLRESGHEIEYCRLSGKYKIHRSIDE